MVALSAGDGSVPSLIALRNPGGVIRFRSRASDSGAKMLSLAPDRGAGVSGFDLADQLVVAGQSGVLEGRALGIEVGTVVRVGLLQGERDRVGDLVHVSGGVPAVRVAAGGHADQVADVDDGS